MWPREVIRMNINSDQKLFFINLFLIISLCGSGNLAFGDAKTRSVGNQAIQFSGGIQGISEKNITAYNEVNAYSRKENILIKNHSVLIDHLNDVSAGGINIGAAAVTLLEYKSALTSVNKLGAASNVINNIETTLDSKLRNNENYSQKRFNELAGNYVEEHKEAIKQSASFTKSVKQSAERLTLSAAAGFNIAKATFLNINKLEKLEKIQKAKDGIALVKGLAKLENIKNTLINLVQKNKEALPSEIIAGFRLFTAEIEDLDHDLGVVGDIAEVAESIVEIVNSYKKLIDIKTSIKNDTPIELKNLSVIADTALTENILTNISQIANKIGKSIGIEDEIEAVTSTWAVFGHTKTAIFEAKLDTQVAKLKDGTKILDKAVESFQTASALFETDLGAAVNREPELKQDVFYSDTIADAGGFIEPEPETEKNVEFQLNNNGSENEESVGDDINNERLTDLVNNVGKMQTSDDNFPNLGYVAGKAAGSPSIFTERLYSGLENGGGPVPDGEPRGGARIVRDSVNTFYSNGIDPNIQVMIDSSTLGTYSYTDWGEWNGTGRTLPGSGDQPAERGFWVIGRSSNTNDIPRTGTGIYNGDVQGLSTTSENIGGQVSLTADFGAATVSGSLDLKRASGADWVTLQTGAMSYDVSQDFEINFTSTAATAHSPLGALIPGAVTNVRGAFFGPNAEELAGHWTVSGAPDTGINSAAGVFRAQK